MGQMGELLGLISVSRKGQRANNAAHAAVESKSSFGKDPQQYVLAFPPAPGTPLRSTGVVFIHGGGWSFGNPTHFLYVGRFFADMGFPALLLGYRLAPANKFPDQLHDVMQGLDTGIKRLSTLGSPVERLVVGGHSAGAQLAALLAYDRETPRPDSPPVRGLFTISGPLDFSQCATGRIGKLIDAYAGTRAADADPIAHVNPESDIAVMCFMGTDDPLVSPENSVSFARALNTTDRDAAAVHVIPGAHHTDTLKIFLQDSTQGRVLVDWLDTLDSAPARTTLG